MQHSSDQSRLRRQTPLLLADTVREVRLHTTVLTARDRLMCGIMHDARRIGYIPDRSAKSGFWTVEYYQSYFDVDTKTVRLPPFVAFAVRS